MIEDTQITDGESVMSVVSVSPAQSGLSGEYYFYDVATREHVVVKL